MAPVSPGEMEERIGAFDWAASPLGLRAQWPAELRTALGIALGSGAPVAIYWGAEHVMLYNDAWSGLIGGKHPAALGRPAREVFPEIWGEIGPIFAALMAGAPAERAEDSLFALDRGRGPEEAWFSFQMSPIPLDGGAVGGIFNLAQETTGQVRARQAQAEAEAARRDSEGRFRLLADANLIGVGFGDSRGGVSYVNDELLRMMGRTRAEFEAGALNIFTCVAPEDRPALVETERRLERDGVATGYERSFLRPDGSRTPFIGAAARTSGDSHVSLAMDVTAIRTAEAASRESARRFRALVLATTHAIFRMSADWSTLLELDGRGFVADVTSPREDWLETIVHPDDRDAVLAEVAEALATGGTAALEHRLRRADGSLGWSQSRAVPLRNDAGEIVEWFGALTDITESRRAEARQTLLLAELDHRVKNVLSVVQSIARHSLGMSRGDPEAAAASFSGRIAALAASHTLLAASRWEGAWLASLVETALAPHRGAEPGRVTAGGPDLKVTPRAAQTLALALHELASNAATHGALRAPGGRVSVDWELGPDADRRLLLRWTERGGPAVPDAPRRAGFGLRLLERSIASELRGRVALDFAPGGLQARLDLPLARIAATDAAPPERAPAFRLTSEARPEALWGRRILLVEDDRAVADALASALRDAGCTVIGPVLTLEGAVEAAASQQLDAAMLDVDLAGEPVWPAARALVSQGVPVLLAVSREAVAEPPAELLQAPRLQKPIEPARLVRRLAALVAAS